MKKWDFIIIIFLLVFSLSCIVYIRLFHNSGDTVAVYSGGDLYGRYGLSEDRDICITEGGCKNVISIQSGKVCMRSADCPNQVCVNQGYISENNETICCAPHKLIIVIESNGEGDIDAITR